jgi:ABC-type multidrug transport system permease subunit
MLSKYFNDSLLNKMFKENIQNLIELDRAAAGEVDGNAYVREYPTSFFWQCRVVFRRQLLKTLKQRRPVVVGFLRHIIVGLFYGSIYFKLTASQTQERLSLLFFSIVFMVLGNQQFIPTIFDERLLFYREKAAKAHGTFPYWLTMSLTNIPLVILNSVTFCAIVYSLTGFRDGSDHFGYFFIIVSLSNIVGLFFCQCLSAMSPSSQTAITIFPGALFFLLAFAGFIVQLPTLPGYLRSWAPIISFTRWSFQGLVINEFENNCNIFSVAYASCDCACQSQAFLENFGFDGYGKWISAPILIANAAFFYLMTYFALRHINFEKR